MPTGYIYKIWSLQSDEIYVGSTQCVRKRKSTHKANCNNANSLKYNYSVYQHIRGHGGWEAWRMDVIEQLEFTHKWELSTREAHHIKTLNASLNCKIPTRTKAEYARDNRERLKEYKKQYHIDNRERIIKKSKQHYQANREARKEKNKRYHQVNREREIARRKKYYQDNKQKMLADMNQKIMCYCGASSSKSNLKRHQRTKKHHETFSRKIYDFIWS